MTLKHCNGCDEDKELSEFNVRKSGRWIGKPYSQCKKCVAISGALWQKDHPESSRKTSRQYAYTHKGAKPAAENKLCPAYLGCVIAETVLSHEFPGFKRMPYGNPDYDYECPKGFLIDVKSSCRVHFKDLTVHWCFSIRKNKVPHFFLLIAWKDRETLIPEHLWLIPGNVINGKVNITIMDLPASLAKWSKYERSLKNVIKCCNKLKGGNEMSIIETGNPYDHSERKRESVGPGKCNWCGQQRRVLFRYNDGEPVCNKECNDSYYGR